MPAIPLPPPVTLVTGPEELLVDRAVAAVVARVRLAEPTADVRRLTASEVEPARLRELTSPSLFGDRTVLIIEQAHELGADAAAALAAYLREPIDEVTLVLVHSGAANRAKAVLEACRVVHAAQVTCAKMSKLSDRVDFVRSEAHAVGRPLGDDGARALVDAVGSDLRGLAAACSQLVADTDGPITPEVVNRYYAGRAEVSSFQVADLAMEGRTSEALKQLRYALACGVAPVLLTSAMAAGLRSIIRLGSAPRNTRPGDLARDLGMPPWKIEVVRKQLRGWSPDGLAVAVTAVAKADGAVKGMGGAGDPAYALERAVVAVTAARG